MEASLVVWCRAKPQIAAKLQKLVMVINLREKCLVSGFVSIKTKHEENEASAEDTK